MTHSKNWLKLVVVSAALGFSMTSFAADQPAHHHGSGPCEQITAACEGAGFIKGDWKKGDGLKRDCVNPIMQGKTDVPGATKSLPTVDQKLIDACRKKHPKFGSGKIGSAK